MVPPVETEPSFATPEGPGNGHQPDYHEIYMSWNSALAKHFFNPEMAGRRVVLNASDDMVEEVGRRAALDPATFVRAVEAGRPMGRARRAVLQGPWRARPRGHRAANRHRAEFNEFKTLLREDVQGRVGLVTYEQIMPVLRIHGLDELAFHVESRIASAG